MYICLLQVTHLNPENGDVWSEDLRLYSNKKELEQAILQYHAVDGIKLKVMEGEFTAKHITTPKVEVFW